ncbi:MAG: hypothetical protein ACK5Y2_11430 [Bdellovibrionales bacterium]
MTTARRFFLSGLSRITFSVLVLLGSSAVAQAYEMPENLPGLCPPGECGARVEALYQEFQATPTAPSRVPGMYAGDCYYHAESLNPDTRHYVGLLIDRVSPTEFYLAPILQFFGERNEMADWTLEQARAEMSPAWKEHGPLKFHATSATQYVLDGEGAPAYRYWIRQNPESGKILFMVQMVGFGVGVCEAQLNPGGSEAAP